MSVLLKSAIVDKMREGKLVITPILHAKQLGAASIDLRMGNVFLMVRARGSSHVDPLAVGESLVAAQKHDIATRRWQKHERYVIPFKTRFLLHPGTLALVPTLEWVMLPEDLHGSVTARSTWAREGLSIATATFVEPGYQGTITLELANLGQIPIALYPGLRIAQIAFISTEKGESFVEESKPSQFHFTFEPRQGDLVKEDDLPFLPIDPKKAN